MKLCDDDRIETSRLAVGGWAIRGLSARSGTLCLQHTVRGTEVESRGQAKQSIVQGAAKPMRVGAATLTQVGIFDIHSAGTH